MDEKYDIIILGTGLKECILSGLLSADGKKVLHLDKNDYYGGDSASLNIEELYNRYKQNETPKSELIENNKKYIIDLCPKFLMACGNLVKTLVHTKVTRYLDFKTVEGSYVFKDGSLFKMPATPTEALSSSLMGFFQKRKLRNFLNFADSVKEEDPKSQKDLKSTMRETFEHFGLDENSIVSIGHALALYKDDSYLDDPKERFPFLEAIKLYAYSVQRYGVSPFIYPIYSLSGLPEGFARLSAVHGGVYMLNKPIDQIIIDQKTNKVKAVRSGNEIAECDQLLCSPSYLKKDDLVLKGKTARWIFILNHPIEGTNMARSSQIIIPGKRAGRKNDIYVAVVSSQHKVAPKEIFIASVSSLIETEDPKKELEPAKKLIGDFIEEFYFETENLEPSENYKNGGKNVFVTSSYDATTHFETVSEEVLELYEKITKKPFNLSVPVEKENVENIE